MPEIRSPGSNSSKEARCSVPGSAGNADREYLTIAAIGGICDVIVLQLGSGVLVAFWRFADDMADDAQT